MQYPLEFLWGYYFFKMWFFIPFFDYFFLELSVTVPDGVCHALLYCLVIWLSHLKALGNRKGRIGLYRSRETFPEVPQVQKWGELYCVLLEPWPAAYIFLTQCLFSVLFVGLFLNQCIGLCFKGTWNLFWSGMVRHADAKCLSQRKTSLLTVP